ncbi:PTR2-domain-containing protein [Coccomyxa subellipsoidea C-169]|uniref:PTR2-domain-containing protein n=1 Tax=Coccomyxa subellipsoidea (strain C-169) TaxID=574566 RepID=I0YMF4_COCSC|nr:PTR2-domain-containing protein [Coccomyxa subellipsoidea C-169]EIE19573.1 PTR2-domain-containing protein [Coccomyxa subellipsoidea C-169]|eukprot:XP_005644117.1 PTR2-domain-containing protein [Coccomyxa subellipsoidea C-169]
MHLAARWGHVPVLELLDSHLQTGQPTPVLEPAAPVQRAPEERIPPVEATGNELCERLAYYRYAADRIRIVYLTHFEFHESVTNWSGTVYIFPLLGAFLADSYWGRYNTIIIFSIIYILGLVGVTLSAGVPALNEGYNGINSSSFFIGMLYIVALGTGGIKPCVSSFGADQFDESDPKQAREKSSFFNWFYWMINIGALIASLLVVNLQTKVSWAWGYAVPTMAFGVALALFLLGTRLYQHVPPGGSALTRIGQVLFACVRKIRVKPPKDNKLLYEVDDKQSAVKGSRKLTHTEQMRWLDRAATPMPQRAPGRQEKWLYTVTQVEEVKRMLGFVPIMIATIVFNTVYAQMSTVFVEQGLTMDLSMGPNFSITSASLSAFDTIAIILLIPFYDRILIPFLTRYNLQPSYLQRVGIGLVISTFSMVVAAIVEAVRLGEVHRLGLENSTDPVPMSVFWLVPQYFIIGAAEIMVNIGTLEMFYSEAPDAMRSLGSALQLLTTSLGSYLASAVTSIVASATTKNGAVGWLPNNLNQGRLDYYYVVLVIMSVLNVFFFISVARMYKYKKVETRNFDPEGTPAGVVDTPHGGLEVETHHEAKSGTASRPHNYQPLTPPCYGRISGGDARD